MSLEAEMTLSRAAEMIAERGLAKGVLEGEDGSLSVLQAIDIGWKWATGLCGWDPQMADRYAFEDQARMALHRAIAEADGTYPVGDRCERIIEWNDRPELTAEGAVAMLAQAKARLGHAAAERA